MAPKTKRTGIDRLVRASGSPCTGVHRKPARRFRLSHPSRSTAGIGRNVRLERDDARSSRSRPPASAAPDGRTVRLRSVRTFAKTLAELVEGSDPFANRATWARMNARTRNDGRSGMASYAVSAVDVALWDLRARLLGKPLCHASCTTWTACRSMAVGVSRRTTWQRCASSSAVGRPPVWAL